MEGMPRSIGYTNNSPAQPNQESSSSKLLLPTTDKRRNIESGGILSPTQTQTLDQCHHQFNAQHHQHKQRRRRELNQDPDQPQLASATTAGASNSNTPPSQAQPEANHVEVNSIRYRECLKNHAASIGGHVVDGCGEFMPSGDKGTPEALKCAACECHRNFHRRETRGRESQQLMSSFYHAHNHNGNNRIRTTTNHHIQPPSSQQYHPHPHPHHHHQFLHHYSHSLASPTTGGPMKMAFGGAGRGPAESSSKDLNMFHSNARGSQPMAAVPPSFSVSKKRFRTKFSKEQKDRMHEVAEKLGWKIQKQDDEQVQKLCDELGVKRQVFKVWMHNNKQAMKKKQHE